jgi:ABC-2 type transport system ATP-binding protein
MEEAEKLCQQLAIIDHGRIIAMGTLTQLRAKVGERDLLRCTGNFDPGPVRLALARLDGAEVMHVDTESLTLAMPDATRKLPAALQLLDATGARLRETTLTQPSLESLFISLTGNELRE